MDKNVALSKAYFLILIRFLLIFCCIVILFIQRAADSLPNLFSFNESKLLIGCLVLNLIYILIAHLFYRRIDIFLLIQIGTDLLLVTMLIYVSGGMLSMYLTLYFGPILAAGILVNSAIGFIYASLATIGISLVTLTYFLAATTSAKLPWVSEQMLYPFLEHDYPFLRAYLFAQGLSFHLVALFIHWLSGVMNSQRILHDEILHNLADGVIVVDTKQIINFINKNAKEMLSLSDKETYEGRQLQDIFSAPQYTKILSILKKLEKIRIEIEIEHKGSVLPILLTITPFSTKKQIHAYIIIFHDITDQKRMEEALKQSQRLQTISEVASTIAHEIRNPLASIRGAIQELRNSFSTTDEKYLLLDIAIKEADRVNHIIGDFLYLSKVRFPNISNIFLNHLIDEFVFFLKKRPDMSQSEVILDIQQNLWVLGDPEQLKQVFYNLAINALEAANTFLQLKIVAKNCPAKIFATRCRVPVQQLDNPGVAIYFIDKGKGINSQYSEKIFQPFFTTKEHGTGMGLALVTKIMDMHQGLYYFHSIPGDDTTFGIWLPNNKIFE